MLYYKKWKTRRGIPISVKLIKFIGYLPPFSIENRKYEGQEWLVEVLSEGEDQGKRIKARFRENVATTGTRYNGNHIDEGREPSGGNDNYLNFHTDTLEEYLSGEKSDNPDFLMKHELKKEKSYRSVLRGLIKESEGLIHLYLEQLLDFIESPSTGTLNKYNKTRKLIDKKSRRKLYYIINTKMNGLLSLAESKP